MYRYISDATRSEHPYPNHMDHYFSATGLSKRLDDPVCKMIAMY